MSARPGRRHPQASERWIGVTVAMAAQLRAAFIRTGYDARSVLADAPDKPARLNARIIQGWLYGEALTTDAVHWDYVMARLGAMPDRMGPAAITSRKKRRIAANTPDHQPITEADRAALRLHRERTGIGGAVLLRGAMDKPEGLSPAMISGWLIGRTATAKPGDIVYVLTRYAAWPSRPS